jgi:uncharacterized protein (UPF0128 family)
MSILDKYTVIEDPSRYSHDRTARIEWLRARGWKLVVPGNNENEVWLSEDGERVQGRTNACRHTLGLPPL